MTILVRISIPQVATYLHEVQCALMCEALDTGSTALHTLADSCGWATQQLQAGLMFPGDALRVARTSEALLRKYLDAYDPTRPPPIVTIPLGDIDLHAIDRRKEAAQAN